MSEQQALGEAFVPIRATLDKLDADLAGARGKIEGAMSKIVSGVGRNMQSIGKLSLGAVAGLGATIGAATGGIIKLASDAEPLLGLQQGFANVTDRIGTSSDTMLSALQDASGGLITNQGLMESFNKAASLVSDDFAEGLPDAMSLVRRAAQSTGQDMGFLFDSLVTGVGRASPEILDNLGIQVSLADATERAAEMFGKSAEELSKQELQAGMNAVTMEKLTDAYGNVPDTSNTFAKIRTSMANLKDEIGMKLLPVIGPLAEEFMGLAERILPPLMDILENNILPVIGGVADAIGGFIGRLMDGENPIGAISQLLQDFGIALGLDEDLIKDIITGFQGIVEWVGNLISTITPYVEMVWGWITQNIELKDVLLGLGIAIGLVIVTAVAPLILAAAQMILVFGAIVGAIDLVRTAWENDWGGIQTALTSFWENTALPLFNQLKEWLSVNIPLAIDALKGFWENVLLPAIQAVWEWISGTLIPFFQNTVVPWLQEKIPAALQLLSDFWNTVLLPAIKAVWEWISGTLIPFFQDTIVPWLQEKIPAAIQALSDFWTGTLLPAITGVYNFINDSVIPLFTALVDFWNAAFTLAIEALTGLWENVLLPVLQDVGDYISETLQPIFEDLKDFWENTLGPALKDVKENILDKLKTVFSDIRDAIGWVIEKLEIMAGWLKDIELPWWLTPGSPTPFELGLVGINKALKAMNGMTVAPKFDLDSFMPVLTLAGSGEENGAGNQTIYNPQTTIYTNRDPMDVLRASRHLDKLGALS